jgi:hypothetical protein
MGNAMPVHPPSPLRAVPHCLALAIPGANAGAQQSLDAVAWFQGCWEGTASNDRRTVERWHAPAGGEMKGGSRSFAGPNETGGERLRILVEDGKLVYHAHPSTQSPQSFTATLVSATAVTFENLAHDFPQRIVYTKRGTDSLMARIEGDRAGRRPPITFAFRSIDCTGHGEAPVDLAEEALRPFYADLVTRLKAHPQATAAWYVQHAAPEFLHVNHGAPGYMARTGSLRTQEAAARAVASAAAPVLAEYTVGVTMATVLARGDTAEVLAVIRQSARTGPAGQQRLRATEQRRLDRWVRSGAGWKLTSATLVDDELRLDGALSAKNGVPVTPRD